MLCTVLEVNQRNMLVAFTDADNVPQRTYLPAQQGVLAGATIELEDPAQGVPYGNLQLNDILIRRQDLERALHQAGIWRKEDISRQPNLYVTTVVALAGLSLSNVLNREE